MANQPLTDVMLAACNLKAIAPEAFKTFCETLKLYELQLIDEVLVVDAPDVFRAQGKVKTVKALRKHISECYDLRDTYTRRDNNARPSSG